MSLRDKICSEMEEKFFRALRKGRFVVKAEELKASLEREENIFLLDVRTPDEVSSGHIQGTINIPIHDLPNKMDELPQQFDRPIVTVCHVGERSAYATMFLRVFGYNDVKSLELGMFGWKNKGFPIMKT